MTTQRKSKVFKTWQTAWDQAFNLVRGKQNFSDSSADDIAQSIKAGHTTKNLPSSYRKDLSSEAKRVAPGWRSKNDPKGELTGEQVIESQLLDKRTVPVKLPEGELLGTAKFIRQQVYLMQNKGQIKPDLIGSFYFAKKLDPIVVSYEVKAGADNCGYALVECCRQIDVLRRSPKTVSILTEADTKTNSAWGAVIAPPKYYANKNNLLEKAVSISKLLKRGSTATKLRVAFLSWDSTADELVYVGGNWFD